jgi:hypothetical protein
MAVAKFPVPHSAYKAVCASMEPPVLVDSTLDVLILMPHSYIDKKIDLVPHYTRTTGIQNHSRHRLFYHYRTCRAIEPVFCGGSSLACSTGWRRPSAEVADGKASF